MTNEYTTETTNGTTQVQTYDSAKYSTPATKPHKCNCPADAPCRISGRCTCMNSLLTKLNEQSTKK